MGFLDWVRSQSRIRLFEKTVVFLLLFLLPTQFGKHFFFDFSFVNGVKVDYLAIALYTTDILALILIFLYHRSFIRHLKRYKTIFYTVCFFLIINIVQSTQPYMALYTIWKFSEAYFLFFLFRYRKTPVTNIVLPLGLGSIFQLILVLLQFVHRHSLQGLYYFFGERIVSVATPGVAKTMFLGEEILRPYGTFSHPNSLAGFYVLIYAFCLFLQHRKYSFHKQLLVYVLLTVSSMLIFISFSKTAIITYLVLTLVFFIQQDRRSKNRCAVCSIAKFAIPITVAFVFLQGQSTFESIESRLFLLQQSFQVMLDTYFLGTGFGQHLYYQAGIPSPYPFFFLQPVHNIFLLFLLQAGIIFSFFAGGLLVWFLYRYYKTVGLIFIAILLTGMFDHYWITLQQNLLLAAVMIGYATHVVDRPQLNS